jgi:hypothetical protein
VHPILREVIDATPGGYLMAKALTGQSYIGALAPRAGAFPVSMPTTGTIRTRRKSDFLQ